MPDIQLYFAFPLKKNSKSSFRLACLNLFTDSFREYQGSCFNPKCAQVKESWSITESTPDKIVLGSQYKKTILL